MYYCADYQEVSFSGSYRRRDAAYGEGSILIAAASSTQRPALLDALQQLNEEEPSLAMRLDARTGEITLHISAALEQQTANT